MYVRKRNYSFIICKKRYNVINLDEWPIPQSCLCDCQIKLPLLLISFLGYGEDFSGDEFFFRKDRRIRYLTVRDRTLIFASFSIMEARILLQFSRYGQNKISKIKFQAENRISSEKSLRQSSLACQALFRAKSKKNQTVCFFAFDFSPIFHELSGPERRGRATQMQIDETNPLRKAQYFSTLNYRNT